MKKLLLILLLLVNAIVFGQITSLISDCSGTTFNLNSKIPELITNQNPNNTTITFHLTFFDAVSLTNPIANTSAFAGTNGQEIWANVLNNTTGLSSQPSFSLAVTSSNLAVTTSIISPVTCAMGGTIQAIASGGSGNYTYILAPLSVSNSSGIFSGLSPGTYTIYVSEINSCSATSQVVMIAPLSIIAITTIENFLTNSTITITATGGSGPYTYSLDGVIFQSSNVFFVSPGSYVYRVKDSLGCIYTGTVNVANSALPTLSISNGSTIEGNPLIFLIGLSNVSTVDTVINLITSNDSATLNDYTPTTTTITIPAGQTTVSFNIQTQTDNIACEPNETFTLIGTVTSGNTLNSSSSGIGTISDISISNLQSSISFSGNIAILNVTGGFPNYIYSMNGGAFQASNVFTTAYGSFNYFTIEDDNGCSFLVNATTPVAPCNFDFIIYSSQDIPTSTFYLNLTGTFSGNFSYTIDGTQAVLINNLNATILANSLQYGNHYVTVTDSMSGCSITETFIGGTAQLNNISISMTGAYNDYNNDGFTNVGDVVNYQFTVNNPNNVAIDNVNISNQQLIMSGSPITSLAAMSSDSTTFTGTYVITQQDINSGTVFGSAVVTGSVNGQQIINDAGIQTNLNISRGFKLNAFFDTNGNGIQDGVETNFSGGNFTYQLAGATAQNIYSNNGVFYLYENNPNNAYNLSYNLPNYNNFCGNGYVVTTSSYSNVTLSGTGITTYNFAITQGSCTDLSVYLYSVGGPRPGFVNSNYIYFTNNGNATISSGTITFTNDNALSIISTLPVTTATANGFTYNFTNLLPYESRYIFVDMQVPVIPIVNIGQLVTNAVNITIPAGDINTANNSSTLTQDIRGAYDPNDKQESHGPQIVKSTFTANDYLTYKIQFENTGNENAINIRVNDVLSNKLDPTTIKMVDASHAYILDRVGNNLEWKFSGINLPPSVANTQIGHGYVVFQIKPVAGYVVGTTIENTANIYFDFNPAIITNTWNTEFVATLSTNNFAFNSLQIYPNPTKSLLNISNNQTIDKLEITNLLGQTIMTKSPNSLSSTLDLSNAATGVYFVKVFVGNNERVIKIVRN